MIFTQYYKYIEPDHVMHPAEFVINDDGNIVGFVSNVYDNSYDCVLFEQEVVDNPNWISYNESLNWSQILTMLRKALISNKSMLLDWSEFCDLPDITESEEEDED